MGGTLPGGTLYHNDDVSSGKKKEGRVEDAFQRIFLPENNNQKCFKILHYQ